MDIECKICKRRFNMITNTHLRVCHQMTPEAYLVAFPGASLISEEMRDVISLTRHQAEVRLCAREGCKTGRVRGRTQKYCSRSCASKAYMEQGGAAKQSGANGHGFKGGWYTIGKRQKKLARERDQNTCQRCGKLGKGKELHVHHIVPVFLFDIASEAHVLSNLITLCSVCHKTVEFQMYREAFARAQAMDKALAITISGYRSLKQYCVEEIAKWREVVSPRQLS